MSPDAENTDAELLEMISQLGADERRVMLVLARRLLAGQAAYGRLDVGTDRRDFRRERALEIADLLLYSAFIELQQATRPATPLTLDDDDEGSRGDLVIVEVERATS